MTHRDRVIYTAALDIALSRRPLRNRHFNDCRRQAIDEAQHWAAGGDYATALTVLREAEQYEQRDGQTPWPAAAQGVLSMTLATWLVPVLALDLAARVWG